MSQFSIPKPNLPASLQKKAGGPIQRPPAPGLKPSLPKPTPMIPGNLTQKPEISAPEPEIKQETTEEPPKPIVR
jgi:hypothetical protein